MALIIPNGMAFDAQRVRADLSGLVKRTQDHFNIHHLSGREAKEASHRLTAIPKRVTYQNAHTFFELSFRTPIQTTVQDGDILVIGAARENIVMVFDVRPDFMAGEDAFTCKATVDLMDNTLSHSYESYLSRLVALGNEKGENKEAIAAQARGFLYLETMLNSIFENAATSADFIPANEILTINNTRMTAPNGYALPDYQFRAAQSESYGAWAIHAAQDRSGNGVLLFQPRLTDPERFAGRFNNAAANERQFVLRGLELPLDEAMQIEARVQLKDWGPFKRLIRAEHLARLI